MLCWGTLSVHWYVLAPLLLSWEPVSVHGGASIACTMDCGGKFRRRVLGVPDCVEGGVRVDGVSSFGVYFSPQQPQKTHLEALWSIPLDSWPTGLLGHVVCHSWRCRLLRRR